jgi:alkanesulfonate monooxygenase SsuD/methylene tetrahydromethanopterin reductase-like flavin-dependent oxidoreductase (luciferase family)
MEIGIGLPNTVPGTTGEQLTEWARRAEAAGFSSLGTIDRLTYPNLEPLVSLAAAAAVTDRIRLATTILIAPYRINAALLAKQAASVQKISDGRLVLGIAVGGREPDYAVSGVDFGSRGRGFEEMLETLTRIWAESGASSGAPDSEAVGPDVSSNPPGLIVGGSVDATFKRAAKYGDGYIFGGGTPEMVAAAKAKVEAAWQEAGREDNPRMLALGYFSFGDRAEENARSYLGDYYAWLGEGAEMIIGGAAKDAETIKGYSQAFEQAGCDEFIPFPCSSDPDQVDMLAEAAL